MSTVTNEDYGKGFVQSVKSRGNGLDNMKNRSKELDGTITIDTLAGAGTGITLNVPL